MVLVKEKGIAIKVRNWRIRFSFGIKKQRIENKEKIWWWFKGETREGDEINVWQRKREWGKDYQRAQKLWTGNQDQNVENLWIKIEGGKREPRC